MSESARTPGYRKLIVATVEETAAVCRAKRSTRRRSTERNRLYRYTGRDLLLCGRTPTVLGRAGRAPNSVVGHQASSP